MKSIHDLLEIALRQRASDLVLKAGSPPIMRVDGQMEAMDLPELRARDTREFARGIIYSAARDRLLSQDGFEGDKEPDDDGIEADADEKLKQLDAAQEMDIVFSIPNLARVRTNLFVQRGAVGAVLRIIPLHPFTVEQLRLPAVLKDIAQQPQGLIIVTGPTGSGKTTTMAAIIEEINRQRACNIFTIEDPIEYVYTDKKSVIHQREVGSDTRSFAAALRGVTRQSPDVIAIGEMRDTETMDVAMTASEIGHLVITTLHTVSASATVDRIINSFPSHLRRQVSAQLAASLLCVTSQRLVPRTTGKGRIPAVEVLTASPTVRKQIEDGETSDLPATLRDGGHYGMNTMNQALEKLVQDKLVTVKDALQFAGNQTELKQMLRHLM